MNTKSLIIAGVVAITAPVFAQEHGKGGALRPEAEKVGSSAYLVQQAIGEVFLQDHALRRFKTFSVWHMLARFRAQTSSVYDSAQSWTGRNCVTPVRNQGDTSLCWNFAATAALEASYCTNLGQRIDAAEQTVLECFDGRAASTGRQHTSSTETRAYDVMRGIGSEPEARNPFNASRIKPCQKPTFLQEYYGVEGVTILPDQAFTALPSVDAIKQGVVDNGAVTVMSYNTTRFEDFVSNGQPIANTAAEVKIAKDNDSLHEVVIVGWDDTLGAWRVKNSWGTGWGNAGFAWIVYNDLAMISGFFTHVTPKVKRGGIETAWLTLLTFERLIRIPQIWADNPQVQFPSSLGFPPHKMRLVDATKLMIGRSILDQKTVMSWPENVRSKLL